MTMTRQEAIARLNEADYWNHPNETNQLLRDIYLQHGLLLELEVNRNIADSTRAYYIENADGRKIYTSNHRYMNTTSAMTQGMFRLAQLLQQQED